MRRFIPKTLFGQLVLGTFLAQTLLLGTFVSYTIVSEKRVAQERTRQRIVQQLDRLAAACSKQLITGNMSGVHDVLELSRIAPSIEVARLTDLNGKTLAVSDGGLDSGLDIYERAVLSNATQQQIFTIQNGQLEAVTAVVKNGVAVALLWLEPNHAVSLNTVNTVVRVSLTYGAFALLANIVPIFLIARTMTRPLRRLRAATHQVTLGSDLSVDFPLPVTTTNEAGDLTGSFNTMVKELGEQRSNLLETLALLDSLLGNAPIGFAFVDPELRYVRANRFLADLYGRPIEQSLGSRLAELSQGAMAEEMERHLTAVFETGEAIRDVELSMATQSSSAGRRTWLMHFYPVRTLQDEVRWVGLIGVEITERLKAEEILRKTEKLAATGRLAASIAHEINNPLESITNLLFLLQTHEPLNDTALEFVTMAQAELSRVSEITQQTLRFYRQSTLPATTNLTEVLDSVIKLYQPRINAANVSVVRKYRGAPEVFGFSGELRQVFANLIANAIDAMQAGGYLFLRVRYGSGLRADGVWSKGVRISVADTGMGMTEDTRQRLFEAFFTTKQATGTGLGLWVSEEIIRKHSGTVRIKSRDGRGSGSTFMLFLPHPVAEM